MENEKGLKFQLSEGDYMIIKEENNMVIIETYSSDGELWKTREVDPEHLWFEFC